MQIFTDEQKRKIRSELEQLSELISDISTIVGGEHGGIYLASDDFRENFNFDFTIKTSKPAEIYIVAAFNDLGVDIRKQVSDSVYGDYEALGLTLDEYKKLAKGSALLLLDRYKELAALSPEAMQIQKKLVAQLLSIARKFNSSNNIARVN